MDRVEGCWRTKQDPVMWTAELNPSLSRAMLGGSIPMPIAVPASDGSAIPEQLRRTATIVIMSLIVGLATGPGVVAGIVLAWLVTRFAS